VAKEVKRLRQAHLAAEAVPLVATDPKQAGCPARVAYRRVELETRAVPRQVAAPRAARQLGARQLAARRPVAQPSVV
jgi:hypothetical protein